MDTKLLKQKILDLAIRGKLVPQDLNDEPVSVLLEKIRKEKQELIKQGKIKKDKNESTIFVGDDKQHYEKFADGTVKNIENEIPFDIPETWSWCRLKDIGEMCSSRRILQSDWRDSGIPFYRAREIVKLSIYGYVNNELFIDYDKYNELKNNSPLTIPKADDIMISAVGTIGKSYIVQGNDKFYYKDASVLCFKNFGFIHVKFLKLMLDSPFIQKQMIENSNGTTVDTITIDSSKYYIICIPPLSEQKRIVNKIEELFIQVDKIEEEKQSLLNLIDRAKEKVLDLAMKGKLVKQDPNDEPASVLLEKIFEEKKKLAKEGKIKLSKDELLPPQISDDNDYYEKLPKNWCKVKLKDVAYIIAGQSPNGENLNKKGIEFHQGRLCYSDKYLLVSSVQTNKPTKIINENSIVICVRAPVGDVNITTRKICIGRGLAGIIPYNKNNLEFLFYFLKLRKEYFEINGTGSTFKSISTDCIKNLFISIPPENEQNKILTMINDIQSYLNKIKAEL